MNIGIVTTWFERGAAYVSKAYLNVLATEHNVFIYARGGEQCAKENADWDATYVTWGKQVQGFIATTIDWDDYKNWVLSNNLDVVIFNEQHSWDVILKSHEQLDALLGTYIDYYTPETVSFFRLYDFLLCNTKRHFGVFKDHPAALFIPWGTDVDLFVPQPKPKWQQDVVFFHSAGLSPYRKGTDLLIKAFSSINTKARLVIHAQKALELNSEIMQIVSSDKRIEIVVKEVGAHGLYHLGDVYVYPSRLEGIGLTIAEALSSGLPVITTDCPPMNEFIVNDYCGKLIEVEDKAVREDNYYWPKTMCSISSLSQAMEFFVSNPDSILKYKDNARKHAVENLSWHNNARELPTLIENLKPDRTSIRPSLFRKAARWEQKKYPGPLDPIKRLLYNAGGGKLKRWLWEHFGKK